MPPVLYIFISKLDVAHSEIHTGENEDIPSWMETRYTIVPCIIPLITTIHEPAH